MTPYQFGVYDLLVLPPSFPYGGMVSFLLMTKKINYLNVPSVCRKTHACHLSHLVSQISKLRIYNQPSTLSCFPALLTGDRSLVDVVVHELTHSWFGNGVT